MKKYLLLMVVFALALAAAGCDFQLAPTPSTARVTVLFDLGGGGTGFAAIIYAQEVTTGKTFKLLYPAGSHGGVVLPTSAPITLTIDAPGTYVFYARLNEDPDEYHYGYNGCTMGGDCTSKTLKAIDVKPGGTYQVYITERFDIVPTSDAPVNQPWVR